MEHIIQFGVSIDEQKIIDTAINNASREIIASVQHEINEYKRGWQESKLDKLFREEIRKIIEANKDKIIADATEKLAHNLTKVKAVREATAKVINDTLMEEEN